jgi:hypothetical protein
MRYEKTKMIVKFFYRTRNNSSNEPCLDTSLRWYDGFFIFLLNMSQCLVRPKLSPKSSSKHSY